MPKPLSRPSPTSSVANLLDPGIGSAVLAAVKPPPPRPPAFPPAREPDGPDAVYLKREFVLTQTADATLKRLVGLFETATGTTVSNSHVLRAVLSLVADSWPDLEREAARLGPLARPSNARGKEAERVAFERALADALLAGLRASGKAG
jgi:hypothetical protein